MWRHISSSALTMTVGNVVGDNIGRKKVGKADAWSIFALGRVRNSIIFTSATEGRWRLCFHPCLSVCLSVCLFVNKISQKSCGQVCTMVDGEFTYVKRMK